MPWCGDCDRYHAPSALTPEGACPTCGRQLDLPDGGADDAGDERAPWHFKLLVVALVAYLAWRFWELLPF